MFFFCEKGLRQWSKFSPRADNRTGQNWNPSEVLQSETRRGAHQEPADQRAEPVGEGGPAAGGKRKVPGRSEEEGQAGSKLGWCSLTLAVGSWSCRDVWSQGFYRRPRRVTIRSHGVHFLKGQWPACLWTLGRHLFVLAATLGHGDSFRKAINSSASSRPIKNLQIFVLQCVYFCPCPFNPYSLNLRGAPDHLMLLTLSQTSSTSELRTRPAASTGLPEGHLPADALFPGCSLAAFVSSQRPWCSSISLEANYLNLWRLLLIWFDLGTLTTSQRAFCSLLTCR